MLLDRSFGKIGRDQVLTVIRRIGDDIVRIQIIHNFYDFQSSATASVLTPDKRWTVLAEEPPGVWHKAITPKVPYDRLAKSLAERAAIILGVPEDEI